MTCYEEVKEFNLKKLIYVDFSNEKNRVCQITRTLVLNVALEKPRRQKKARNYYQP